MRRKRHNRARRGKALAPCSNVQDHGPGRHTQGERVHAMLLQRPGDPLRPADLPIPEPGRGQVRLRVHACGVCRTDLHILDGELAPGKLPLVPGHQIVGSVDASGPDSGLEPGVRIGVPWLAWTCGRCRFCTSGRENLCEEAKFTGLDVDGGYAQSVVADARYCFRLPEGISDLHLAPLLCAGLIGYRALRMCGDARRIGFYGFGSAAHILTQVAAWQGREVHAFTRPGDHEGQAFAWSLGAVWAGGADMVPPQRLDAAILFAPVGAHVPAALAAVDRGGTVVCAGIHMSDIPSFPYRMLWGERSVRSVANLTRSDGEEFLAMVAQVPVRTEVTAFPLASANEALTTLRNGRARGSLVLEVEHPD